MLGSLLAMAAKTKLLIFLLCVMGGFLSNEVLVGQLSVPKELGLVPGWVQYLPLAAPMLIFVVWVTGWTKREGSWLVCFRKNWLMPRIIIVGLIFWSVSLAGNYFHEAHVGKVLVKDGTSERLDWPRMEAQAGFRLIAQTATGEPGTIWFEQALGREDKVRMLLGPAQ
jgi:hypothetical protein